MNQSEEQLCDTLASVCELQSESAIEAYVTAVKALSESRSDDVLRCMLRCLRDTDAGEVQYELVEACEAFPDYVHVFLNEGLLIHERAPKWFRLMFQSILNTPDDAGHAITILNQMEREHKSAYKQIVSDIVRDTPQYKQILDQMS